MDNETMNNEQVEPQESEQTPIDALENQINALVNDGSIAEDMAAFNAEEAYTDMQARLEELSATNEKLTNMVAKMVTVFGARMNDDGANSNTNPFPSTIEKQFGVSNSNITPLNEIVLGS